MASHDSGPYPSLATATRMDPLATSTSTSTSEALYRGAVSARIMNEVVAACVTYPLTGKLSVDAERTLYLSIDAPNYESLAQVYANTTLDAAVDIAHVLRSFGHIHSSLLLSKVDCLVLYKGGYPLLNIIPTSDGTPTGTHNSTGRSAYLEIYNVRLHLVNFAKQRSRALSRLIALSFAGVVTAALSAWALYVWR